MTTKAELSRMLWDARETAEMYADVVQSRMGTADMHNLALRDRIDAFRAEQGWNPNGFGGEGDDPVRLGAGPDNLGDQISETGGS